MGHKKYYSKYYEKNLIKLNLQYFDGEKTEKPTAQKRSKARSEGQVAKSQEVGTAFLFLAAFTALRNFSGDIGTYLMGVLEYNFNIISDIDEIWSVQYISKYLWDLSFNTFITIIPIILVVLVVGVVSNVIQVGWHPTTKPLMPKFSKLNPISGFKKIFSMNSVLELFKSVAKFTVIIMVVYNTVKDKIGLIFSMFFLPVTEIVSFFGGLAIDIGMSVGMAYLAIAIIDYVYQRYKHTKDLKMSKQEVKDEYRQAEGDPQVKGKIKQKMREASMRRMMQDLPTADVIITNPTHYAVAIKYDNTKASAPYVLAKGVDHMAKRIREAAIENDIEIVENKPLARTLYSTIEIGEEIPEELYQVVAEILAYVYKLKNKV